MIRLLKYSENYEFYKINFKDFSIEKLDFLNFTVKDNVPVYDLLIKD